LSRNQVHYSVMLRGLYANNQVVKLITAIVYIGVLHLVLQNGL